MSQQPIAVWEFGALKPPLWPGQTLMCKECRATVEACDVSPLSEGKRRCMVAECPGCGEPAQFARVRDRAQDNAVGKWGVDAMNAGFVAIPTVLLRYAHRFGELDLPLDSIDLLLLAVLVDLGEGAWASHLWLAQRCGAVPRTVMGRLRRLERHGLINIYHRRGPSGKQQTNVYAWPGLRKLVQALNEGEAAADQQAARENHALAYARRTLDQLRADRAVRVNGKAAVR